MTDTERLDWLDRYAGLGRGPCQGRNLALWNTTLTSEWVVEVDNCLDLEDYDQVEAARKQGGVRAAIDAAIAALAGCDGTVQKCIDTDACKVANVCVAKHVPKTLAQLRVSIKIKPPKP